MTSLAISMIVFAAVQAALPAMASAQAPPNQASPSAESAADQNVAESAVKPAEYRIGAGDVLQVSVWRELEASIQSVVVRPDGKITVPLIKEINVLGLTPVELQKILAGKLEQFIHAADVTVIVREIRSKKAYLVGAVNRVGPVPLLSTMTVLQVLAEAGGLSEYAKRKKIYVLRQENGKQVKHPFDYDAVIRGEHMDENIPVLPDDTIVVPH